MNKMPWVDAAKGVCIFLVVLGHSTGFHPVSSGLGLESSGAIWAAITEALAPIRLAAFFLLSGFLSRRAVNRSWRELLAGRIGTQVYLFGVWTCILVLLFQTVLPFPLPQPDYSLTAFLHPVNHLWYLWALALFVAVAKAVQGIPKWVVLASSWVLSLIAYVPEVPTPDGASANLFFFLLGIYAADHISGVAERATPLRAVALVGAYTVGMWSSMAFFGHLPRIISMVMSVIGIVMLVQVAAVACQRLPAPTKALRRLGRQTLPVYVMEIPLLVFIAWLMQALVPGEFMSLPVLIAYPWIAASLAVVSAIGFKYIFDRTRATGFLLELPVAVRKRVAGEVRPKMPNPL